MLNKYLLVFILFFGALMGSMAVTFALDTYYNSQNNLEIKFNFILGQQLKVRIQNQFPDVIQIIDYPDGSALVVDGNSRNIVRIERVARRLTDILCMPDTNGNIYSVLISTTGQPIITQNDARCLQ